MRDAGKHIDFYDPEMARRATGHCLILHKCLGDSSCLYKQASFQSCPVLSACFADFTAVICFIYQLTSLRCV
jgi:hypothetical protein